MLSAIWASAGLASTRKLEKRISRSLGVLMDVVLLLDVALVGLGKL